MRGNFTSMWLYCRKWVKANLWPAPSLFWPIALVRDRRWLFSSGYDLLVDGFQRSGNTFTSVAFRLSQPELKIISHCHSPTYVIRSINAGKPVCVVVRNPVESIVSWILYSGLDLDNGIDDYILYYQPLLRHLSGMAVVDFKDVVSDFGVAVDRVNQRFGLNLRRPICDEAFVASVRAKINSGLWTSDPLRIPLPSKERQMLAPAIRTALLSPRYQHKLQNAQRVYSAFLAGPSPGVNKPPGGYNADAAAAIPAPIRSHPQAAAPLPTSAAQGDQAVGLRAMAQARTLRVAVTSWTARGLSLAAQLAAMRLMIQAGGIGPYTGLALVLGLQQWFALADLGVGTAAQQQIASLRGSAPDQAAIARTAWSIHVRAAIPLVILAVIIGGCYGRSYLVSIQGVAPSDKTLGCMLGFAGSVASSVGVSAQRILYGFGRGVASNAHVAISGILAPFCAVILLHLLPRWPLSSMAAGYYGILTVYWWAVYGFLVFRGHAHPSSRQSRLKLLRLSKDYLLFAAAGAAVLAVDYIIMSRVCSERSILSYNIIGRLVTPCLLIVSSVFNAFQPEGAFLLSRGEGRKVWRSVIAIVLAGTMFVAGVVYIFALNRVRLANVLAPHVGLSWSLSLFAFVACYFTIRVFTDGMSTILVASGRVKPLLKVAPIQALIVCICQAYLGGRWGAEGIFLSLIVAFLATVTWYLPKHALAACRKATAPATSAPFWRFLFLAADE